MMRRIGLWLFVLLIGSLPAISAQDGLNLPTELYILLNEGVVERYGMGMAGVMRVTPDGEFVLDFRVAPDGNWLAWRTQSGIAVGDMFNAASTRLIEAERASLPRIRGRGETIAWSPASDVLAYTTEYGGRVHFFEENTFADLTTPDLQHLLWSPDGTWLAAEASGGVWWLFQRSGTSMNLTAAIPGANGGTWVGPSHFLFAPQDGGLIVMNLADNNRQTTVATGRSYYIPQMLADGSIRAFAGEPARARLTEITFSGDTASEQVIGTGDVDLTGLHWAPGGMLLTAFQGGVLALVEPVSGLGFTLPITSAAAYGWGPTYPPAAAGLVLPADGYFLSLDNSSVIQLWRLPADGSIPATLTPSVTAVSEYALTTDRSRIAYVSNQTLFIHESGSTADPLAVPLSASDIRRNPAWSPDHTTLYYRDEAAAGSGIWRVQLGGEPELFLSDEAGIRYDRPLPAPGVGAMLVDRGDELLLVDTTSGETSSTGMNGSARWLQGTEFTVLGQPKNSPVSGSGLYRLDVNNLEPVLLLPVLGELRLLDYQVLGDGTIRALAQNRTPGTIRILDLQADGSGASLVANAGYMVNPVLSPDGTVIIGQTIPGGTLLVFDITSGARFLIDTLPQASQFRWR